MNHLPLTAGAALALSLSCMQPAPAAPYVAAAMPAPRVLMAGDTEYLGLHTSPTEVQRLMARRGVMECRRQETQGMQVTEVQLGERCYETHFDDCSDAYAVQYWIGMPLQLALARETD